jgi:hypothetical protein
MHYDILPVKPVFQRIPQQSNEQHETPPPLPKTKPASQIFVPRKQIPPDPRVTIADREQYGYTNCQELLPLLKERAIILFKRNMTIYLLHSDNRESIVLDFSEIETHSGIFGVPHMEWYNSHEYLSLASGNPNAQKEASFVYDNQNAFAVYQIKDGEADTHTEPYRYQTYNQLAQLGLLVDYNNYNIVYTGSMLPTDNLERLYMRFNMNKPQGYSGKSIGISDVLSLNTDSVITSHYVDEGKYTELMSFIGIEKPRAKPGKECDSNEKSNIESASETISKETLPGIPPPDDSASEVDEVLAKIASAAEDFSDVDIYAHSLEQAKKHGTVEGYNFSLMVNLQCVSDIDLAIKKSKVKDTESEYRLTKAVDAVIRKYGRNRIAWVLSVVIKNAEAEKFTNDNTAWALEALKTFGFPQEPPTFSIKTNPVLLNIFIQRFREAQSQKSTYQERVLKAGKQVRAQNSAPL